jgi:DNA-binding NarL/FixJ family response regulator
MKRPRILIADDQPDIVQNLERRLRQHGYAVLKPVMSLSRVVPELRQQCPDLLVFDAFFGKESALSRLGTFRKACPVTRLIVYTRSDDAETVRLWLSGGVSGYLLKHRPDELFAGIECALAGDLYVSVAVRALAESSRPSVQFGLLTREQRKLLSLLQSGRKQASLANEMGLTRRTFERRVADLATALGLRQRDSYHVGWRRSILAESPAVLGDVGE